MPIRNKSVIWIFYLMALYILLQTIWWGWHIVQLSRQKRELLTLLQPTAKTLVSTKEVAMVMGEGLVFVTMLAIGFWQLHRYVKRELTMAAVEKTFLLSMTHEIKTPIAAIRLLSQTGLKHPLDKEQITEMWKQSLRETEKLQVLTDNVLMAARLHRHSKELNLETIELGELVKEYTENSSLLNKEIENLVLDISAPARITGDSQLLSLLVANLCDNALKYGHSEKPVVVQVKPTGKEVHLIVSDFGPGIPTAQRQLVFDKYYRLPVHRKLEKRGTGLGLYLVKNIARLHQAKIVVRSNEPTGTIIQIAFNSVNEK